MCTEDLISIIIPVFNAQETIDQCLNSIICCKYQNLEIIVINDGSTDASSEIINDFSRRDERIKIITCENNGVSSARNIGIRHATGIWCCFIDSDDFISADYFDILINDDACNYDIIQMKNIVFSPKQNNMNFFKRKQIFPMSGSAALKEKYAIYVWGKLYKSSILKNTFFSRELSIGEDYYYNCQVFKNASIYYSNEGVYYYSLSPGSLSRGDSTGSKIWERFKSANKIFYYLRDNDEKLALQIFTTFGFIGTLRAYSSFKWILYLIKEIDVEQIKKIKFSAVWTSSCNLKAKILSTLVLCSMMVIK